MTTAAPTSVSLRTCVTKHLPNNALLTDAYSSPLRTQHGAANRGR